MENKTGGVEARPKIVPTGKSIGPGVRMPRAGGHTHFALTPGPLHAWSTAKQPVAVAREVNSGGGDRSVTQAQQACDARNEFSRFDWLGQVHVETSK
jgi:hypothetical protein